MGQLIRRQQPLWKDREHLFTPASIARYERCTMPHVYKKPLGKIKVKPLPNSPVYSPCVICLRTRVVTPFVCADCMHSFVEPGRRSADVAQIL